MARMAHVREPGSHPCPDGRQQPNDEQLHAVAGVRWARMVRGSKSWHGVIEGFEGGP